MPPHWLSYGNARKLPSQNLKIDFGGRCVDGVEDKPPAIIVLMEDLQVV
jgi:hypothetical protein